MIFLVIFLGGGNILAITKYKGKIIKLPETNITKDMVIYSRLAGAAMGLLVNEYPDKVEKVVEAKTFKELNDKVLEKAILEFNGVRGDDIGEEK